MTAAEVRWLLATFVAAALVAVVAGAALPGLLPEAAMLAFAAGIVWAAVVRVGE